VNTSHKRLLLTAALTALLGACATVPQGPPPEVVRLQSDLDRLHSDPRIAANAGAELGNADAAVDVLARNSRSLDADSYQQGVYIADRLIRIAEASALARFEEERGAQLGAERERLLARASMTEERTVVTEVRHEHPVRTDTGELVPRARAELMSMQEQLPGVESRLDARGLVIRLGDFMFEPGQAMLTGSAQQSLDGVARVLNSDTDAGITIEGFGGPMALARTNAVRDYLDARGVDISRIDARSVTRRDIAMADGDRRVDIVIRSEYR